MRTSLACIGSSALLLAGACTKDDDSGGAELRAAFSAEFDHVTTGSTTCPVVAVRFRDQSKGDPTSWAWSFGDGVTSKEQHPTWETERIVAEVTLTVRRGNAEDSLTELVNTYEC